MLTHAPGHEPLVESLTVLAAECLEVSPGTLCPTVPLTRYGLDSLARVELTFAVERLVNCRLPESLLVENPDLNSLASYLSSAAYTPGPGRNGLEQMRADSILPPDVQPPELDPAALPRDEILLTGATGLLGSHLLFALLQGDRGCVWCLVRAPDDVDALERVKEAMLQFEIWDPGFAPRIRAVAGDLTAPRLGLDAARHAELAGRVGSVWHLGAAVDWVSPYAALRPVNVEGTLSLLRFACSGQPKPFHFASTVASCYSTRAPREIGEEHDPTPYLGGLHLGYAQSKCVAETLVRQAAERGLPVGIYRASLISGSRARAVSNPDDLLTRMIRSAVLMGAAPDLDWSVDCCPVDHVAQALLHLARDPAPCRLAHIVNPAPRHWRELILWMNLFGYPVQLVPYTEWAERLAGEAAAPGHPLQALRRFFLHRPVGEGGLSLPELYEDHRSSRIRSEVTRQALATAPVPAAGIDAHLLDRYFQAYIDRGSLPPPNHGRRPGASGRDAPDAVFFTKVLRQFHGDPDLEVLEVVPRRNGSAQSILTELTSWRYGSGAGLWQVNLTVRRGGRTETMPAVAKRKAGEDQVLSVGRQVAEQCSRALGDAFRLFGGDLGFAGTRLREPAIYRQRDSRFRRHAPLVYGIHREAPSGSFTLVLEDISGLDLMDSADDPRGWTPGPVGHAIHGLGTLHGIWYGREGALRRQPWLGRTPSSHRRTEMGPLWSALAEHARATFVSVLGSGALRLQQRLVDQVRERWQQLEVLPRTLIHNDFNPRNLGLRPGGDLCAYDWELATLGPPQRDLAEFLCFVLGGRPDRAEVECYLDTHRHALERSAGHSIEPKSWATGFRLCLHDLLVDRLALYTVIHRFRPQRFLERVLRTWQALYELYPLEREETP